MRMPSYRFKTVLKLSSEFGQKRQYTGCYLPHGETCEASSICPQGDFYTRTD